MREIVIPVCVSIDRTDEGSSAPVFIAQPLQQTAVEGSDVTLECAANGYPKPTILWLKDGVALDLASLSSRYRIIRDTGGSSRVNVDINDEYVSSRYRKLAASSLTIMNVRESDHGSYQCRAENEVESLDAVAELIVQGEPEAQVKLFIRRDSQNWRGFHAG